jgi:hypothetical protein
MFLAGIRAGAGCLSDARVKVVGLVFCSAAKFSILLEAFFIWYTSVVAWLEEMASHRVWWDLFSMQGYQRV